MIGCNHFRTVQFSWQFICILTSVCSPAQMMSRYVIGSFGFFGLNNGSRSLVTIRRIIYVFWKLLQIPSNWNFLNIVSRKGKWLCGNFSNNTIWRTYINNSVKKNHLIIYYFLFSNTSGKKMTTAAADH